MTRERAGNYDDKKQAILSHAATLFAFKGFESTTMIDVAKACGATKSMLYHYFPSKEKLLNAIIGDHIDSLLSELSDIVRLALPAQQRFARFVGAFVERAAESQHQHLILMNSLKFLPATEQEGIRHAESQLVDLLIGLLKEINPTLMLPDKMQTPYAMLAFGMFIWTFTWYQKSGSVSPDELAARVADLLLNGFMHARFAG